MTYVALESIITSDLKFHNLEYPKPLVETSIKRFVERRISTKEPRPSPDVPSETLRVVLPFKNQSSANYVKQQLNNLSSKLNVTVQPVFTSPKLEQQFKRHEYKPPIVNQQCLVYEFKCNLCDARYVGYTRGHLHERVEGDTRKSSSIYKHYNLQHNSEMPERFIELHFTPSRNLAANLIASLKKYYTFACVNQHWTCKRIPSVSRCLFRSFILISVLILYFSLFTCDLTSLLIMKSWWTRNVEQ